MHSCLCRLCGHLASPPNPAGPGAAGLHLRSAARAGRARARVAARRLRGRGRRAVAGRRRARLRVGLAAARRRQRVRVRRRGGLRAARQRRAPLLQAVALAADLRRPDGVCSGFMGRTAWV